MTLWMRDRENMKLGANTLLVSLIRQKYKKGKSANTIANEIERDVVYVDRIISMIENYPDWDDEDIVSGLLA